jgi:hypothetical protein
LAQKGDSFGKDSEASVALGQGKPVIVYVPKLVLDDERETDMEVLGRRGRNELVDIIREEGDPDDADIDDAIDDESLLGRILTRRLEQATDHQITGAISRHWADFDLHSEAERIKDSDKGNANEKRETYREWLDHIIDNREEIPIPAEIKDDVVGILVATALQFERRAKLFREIHPLALQVILSSGVLNGILVVRSVEQCARILRALLENTLDLDYNYDAMNYKLVERITGSTVRVISRHRLLRNAFEAFYAGSRSY